MAGLGQILDNFRPRSVCTVGYGIDAKKNQRENSLVPRTRSSHHNCRESDCELRVQSGTRIIELLVSFDSEVRYGACGKLRRTSESGHEGGHLMNRYYALTIGAAMIFSALPLLGTPVLAADPRVADL